MSKKTLLVIGAVLVLLVVPALAYVGYYYYGTSSSDTAAVTANDDSVGPDEHVMGSAKAPVTMIEYFAQACSVCSRFDQDVFPLLKAKYIDTGKVRYVMRLYPLFPIDGPSYKLDMCMPPDKFFEANDLLFRNQAQWDSAEYQTVTDAHAGLIRMARILGLDATQADACMNSTKYDDSINKVAKDADARYQPNGTPTFILDYKKPDYAFAPGDPTGSWQKLQAVIDAELAAKGAK